MENEESEFSFLNMILKDFLSNFCHCCIETICNEALKSIYKIKIEPEKSVTCYLMFLREKILNTEIECKNKEFGCNEKIMFGELRHHLLVCKFGAMRSIKNGNINITKTNSNNCNKVSHVSNACTGNTSPTNTYAKKEPISFSDLTISSTSSSIINSNSDTTKKSNKKKKNKK